MRSTGRCDNTTLKKMNHLNCASTPSGWLPIMRAVGYSRERQEQVIDLWRELRPGLKSDRQAALEVSDRTGVPAETIRRWVKRADATSPPPAVNEGVADAADLFLRPNSVKALVAQLDSYTDSLERHQRTVGDLRARFAELADTGNESSRDNGAEDLDALLSSLRAHQSDLRDLTDSVMSIAVGTYRHSLQAVASSVGMSATGVRRRVANYDIERAYRFLDSGDQLLEQVEVLMTALKGCGGVLNSEVENAFKLYFELLTNVVVAAGYGQRWMTPEHAQEPTLLLLDNMRLLNRSVYDAIERVGLRTDRPLLRSAVELEVALDSIHGRLAEGVRSEAAGSVRRVSRPPED